MKHFQVKVVIICACVVYIAVNELKVETFNVPYWSLHSYYFCASGPDLQMPVPASLCPLTPVLSCAQQGRSMRDLRSSCEESSVKDEQHKNTPDL